MLLTIDIGNTNIDLGLFKQGSLVDKWRVCSSDYQNLLKTKEKKDIKAVIICSVVPFLEQKTEKIVKEKFNIQPLIVGKDVSVNISNLYQKPEQVGSDRLVNSLAAAEIYGFPVIVVDFGTAITFDFVSKNREYLGGIIAPGINLSVHALCQKAALLPKIELDSSRAPKDLMGRNTTESMLAGLTYGFGSLCDGIIRKMKKRHGENILTVGTGGDISFIASYCLQIDKIDADLNLKGLWFVYSQKSEKK
ncbi:MAG: type III pantothenate kinase [Candidatus Omnitrophica bacterium]|nr:type III pantothenate kinase [Candidatus Omnitrophota bacterium]